MCVSAGGRLLLRGVQLRHALLFHPSSPSAQAGWVLPHVYHAGQGHGAHLRSHLCSAGGGSSGGSWDAGGDPATPLAAQHSSTASQQLVLEDVGIVTHCRMLRDYIKACGGSPGAATDGSSFLWLQLAQTPLVRLLRVNLTCSGEGTQAPAISPPLFTTIEELTGLPGRQRVQQHKAGDEPVGVVHVTHACQGDCWLQLWRPLADSQVRAHFQARSSWVVMLP